VIDQAGTELQKGRCKSASVPRHRVSTARHRSFQAAFHASTAHRRLSRFDLT
jgi:hypothetical protein